jgi:hypothetical protein
MDVSRTSPGPAAPSVRLSTVPVSWTRERGARGPEVRFSPAERPHDTLPPLAAEAIDSLIESVRSYRAGFPPERLGHAAESGDPLAGGRRAERVRAALEEIRSPSTDARPLSDPGSVLDVAG